jgi:uncharacterized protein (DUF1810 family)
MSKNAPGARELAIRALREAKALLMDKVLYGKQIRKDGRRVDPTTVKIKRQQTKK